MAEPTILYCVGATKAGTSWFYRRLSAHPQCAVRPVKEAHYWDTAADPRRNWQIKALRERLIGAQKRRVEAAASSMEMKAANLDREIEALTGLIGVIEGDRTDDAAYLAWLMQDSVGKKLVADVTPSYSLLPEDRLTHMANVGPVTRFVYLIRDPVARLWSHVRMQAGRKLKPHQDFQRKATLLMQDVLDGGEQDQILSRGDYPGNVARLRRALPDGILRIEYCERLFTEDGLRDMSAFLDIDYVSADGAAVVHEGMKARLDPDLAVRAAGFLREHYDWAAREMGPLPREWQDNMARSAA